MGWQHSTCKCKSLGIIFLPSDYKGTYVIYKILNGAPPLCANSRDGLFPCS